MVYKCLYSLINVYKVHLRLFFHLFGKSLCLWSDSIELVYTYLGCSILVEPSSVLIASLFRKKARLAVEDIIQPKEIGFFRVLVIEGRNTGKYYFPCDAYNLGKFLAMMHSEHPEVFIAKR